MNANMLLNSIKLTGCNQACQTQPRRGGTVFALAPQPGQAAAGSKNGPKTQKPLSRPLESDHNTTTENNTTNGALKTYAEALRPRHSKTPHFQLPQLLGKKLAPWAPNSTRKTTQPAKKPQLTQPGLTLLATGKVIVLQPVENPGASRKPATINNLLPVAAEAKGKGKTAIPAASQAEAGAKSVMPANQPTKAQAKTGTPAPQQAGKPTTLNRTKIADEVPGPAEKAENTVSQTPAGTKPVTDKLSSAAQAPAAGTKPVIDKLSSAAQAPAAGTKPVTDKLSSIAENTVSQTPAGTKPVTDKLSSAAQAPAAGTKPVTDKLSSMVVDKQPFSVADDEKPASISQKFTEIHQNQLGAEQRSQTAQQRLSTVADKLSTRPVQAGQPDEKPGAATSGKVSAPVSSPSPLVREALETAQVTISNGKGLANTPLASGDNAASEVSEQIPGSFQPAVTQQTSSSPPAPPQAAPNTPAGPDTAANVAEQINETIRASLHRADQQVTINLNPPELGRVRIKFSQEADQITGLLEVDKMQTRSEIQQALPQIVHTLRELGVQVKRMEVVLNENALAHNGSGRNEPSADQGYPHKHSLPANYNSEPANTGINGWQLDEPDYTGRLHLAAKISDNSINMWI